MARISLDPQQSFSYRIGSWFLRRQFGEVLDPFRAQGHNVRVAKAFGKLEQQVAKWDKLDPRLRDLADMTAAVTVGCPWCMDLATGSCTRAGSRTRRSRRYPGGARATCSIRSSAWSWSTPRRCARR